MSCHELVRLLSADHIHEEQHLRRITAVENVSLDGVMQAPGGADEDTRDGFAHGGWAGPYGDHVLGEYMGRGMAEEGALLFGRRTYEQFFRYWPHQTDNPFTAVLDARTKYVTSTKLADPLPWQNSVALPGDAGESVARLKAEDGPDLTLLGSGELLQTLVCHDLVDEFVLTVHPLVLGSGQRLFRNGGQPTSLELVETLPTTTGVIIARYRAVAMA